MGVPDINHNNLHDNHRFSIRIRLGMVNIPQNVKKNLNFTPVYWPS